ncbi:MAG: dihydrofolate reductase [Planctomycetota bacterium]
MSDVAVIVAHAENRVIGRDGQLPWHLPEDLRRFRRLTTGHAIVMGRLTYESVGRPLPHRRNIVLSRRLRSAPEGVELAPDLDAALALPGMASSTVFVAGGAEVYRAALPRADRLYLTVVHADVEGDVLFPEVDFEDWRLIEDERRDADERHEHAFSFRVYTRN